MALIHHNLIKNPNENTKTFELALNVLLILTVALASTTCSAYALETEYAGAQPEGQQTSKQIGTAVIPNGEIRTVEPGSMPANVDLKQIPSLIDIPQTPESIEKVLKLEDEGETFFQQKLLDKALAKWQDAYGLALEMKYAEGEGRALTNMCRLFLERGQFVKAKYMGENAIEVLSGVPDRKALGRAHLHLAQAYFGLENPYWAGQQLDEAMKAFTADGGNNASDTAQLMNLAAAVLINMGKVREAMQFFQAAATYYSQAGDNGRAIDSHLKIVDILLGFGLLTAAEEQAEKAVSVARGANGKPNELVGALSAQANCWYSLGEYNRAKTLYEQSIELVRTVPTQVINDLGRANLDLGYGSSLVGTGELDAARPHLERALTVFKSSGGSLAQAQSANALAVLEQAQGHDEKAKALLETALDLHNLIVPKNDNFHVLILQNLASIESRLGQNRSARAHLETAATQLKKMKDTASLGRTYAAATEISIKLAEDADADRFVREAISLSEKVNDDSTLWREHTLLAKLQLAQGNINGARDSLTSALSFFRSPQAGYFPSPERIPYPTSRTDMAQQLISMLVQQKMTEPALLAAEQLKEETFINAWFQHGGQVRPDDAEMYTDLASQRAHLHAAEVSSSPDKITKDWQAWMGRFRALMAQNRNLARLIAPIPIPMSEISKTLQALHSTAIEYVVGSDSTVVFTVSGGNKIGAAVLPVGYKKLEGQVSSLVSLLTARASERENYQAPLAQKNILRSVYGELLPSYVNAVLPADSEQLLSIVPDGVLYNLPFAALVDEQGKYFVEKHTFALANSLSALVECQPQYHEEMSLLLVKANGRGASDLSDRESGLSEITELFRPESCTSLSGKNVDIKSIEDQAHGRAVVQLADEISLSYGNLWKGNLPFPVSHDDGAKHASIANLFGISLPCDLFVSSASYLDSKSVDGNVLKVFTSGLNYAGVRNVMPGLWLQSDSDLNRELVALYKNRQAGLSLASAWRRAELAAIANDPAPKNWAACQLFGPGN